MQLGTLLTFTYEANNALLDVITAHAVQDPEVHRLFSHVLNAQLRWLHRLRGEEASVGIWEDHDPAEWRDLNKTGIEGLRSVLDEAKQEPDGLDRIITYTAGNGKTYASSLEEVFTQLITHGAHHRGQIAMRLKGHGLTPPPTDYIFWSRKEVV
jgi:Uncharacterized protein conserved in bacteria